MKVISFMHDDPAHLGIALEAHVYKFTVYFRRGSLGSFLLSVFALAGVDDFLEALGIIR